MRYVLPLLLLITILLGIPRSAEAHSGLPNTQTIVQQLAGSELTITMHPPTRLPGMLQIEVLYPITTERILLVRAAPRTQPMPTNIQGQIRIFAEQPGPYYLQLPVDQAGDWEISVQAEGAGSAEQVAVLPFNIPSSAIDSAEMAVQTIFALLACCLLVGFGSTLLSIRFRSMLWLPITTGVVAAIVLGIAMTLAVQPQSRQGRLAGTANARPFVNMLVTSVPKQPQADQPITLTLQLVDGGSGRVVDDLVLNHEALAHLIVISANQHFFLHTHPTRTAPGQYAITFTPTQSGNYWLYLEIARQDSGTQVLRQQILVAGESAEQGTFLPELGTQQIGPMLVATSVSETPIQAGRTTTLRLSVSVEGRPLDQFQPWLGMAGHAIVQGADGALFGHVHAAGLMANSSAVPQPQAGPELAFNYIFPTPGSYMIWLQYKYSAQVWTVPIRVEVQ